MIAHVYRPRRRRNGKSLVSRLYRCRIRLSLRDRTSDVGLGTSDKIVAQKRLAELVRDRERVRAGLIAPTLERESAQKPILEHLADFIADLTALGRSKSYVDHVASRAARILKECKWRHVAQISANSFVTWRSSQSVLSPKTLNEYLHSMNGLLNWMVRQGRVSENPLKGIALADTRGRQQLRRAFTDEELSRLLAVARPDLRLLYLAAALTGLRANELRQLVWGDLRLDCDNPHIVVRALTTKNRKAAIVPLHPELIQELKAVRGADTKLGDRLLSQNPHPHRRIRADMAKAGITRIDETGRKLDFHALRYTFATKLAQSGVSLRTAQELLRHSDPRLTANIYTDVTQLPTFAAVRSLPWSSKRRTVSAEGDAQLDTQKSDFCGQARVSGDTVLEGERIAGDAETKGSEPVLTRDDVNSLTVEPRGLEGEPSSCASSCQSASKTTIAAAASHSVSQPAFAAEPVLSELSRVWPNIPEHIRLAIGALVKSCSV